MRALIAVLMLAVVLHLPSVSAGLDESSDEQYLSCVADDDCRLTTIPLGEEVVSGQAQGTPFAPAEVLLEFDLHPEQDLLVLLPWTISDIEIDLRIDDDPTQLTWPDLDLRLVHGSSVTSWGMAPSSDTGGPAYVESNVELDLADSRVLWPGDDFRLLVGFSLDRPTTWSLHLRGASSFELDVEWSADPAAADVDEPSSRLSPVETEFQTAHDGALVGADVDCFSFEIETHEVLRVLLEWENVPLELQQQSSRPELILSDGRTAPTPEMQVVQDEDRASVRYVWRALSEGPSTMCLSGTEGHYQAYVWAGILAYEGIGPIDPSGFSGEGLYPAGGGQAPSTASELKLDPPPRGSLAVLGTMLLLLGLLDLTRRTTSLSIRFGLTAPGLVLILVAGVVHPIWAASTAVLQEGELEFDDLIDERLAQLWDVSAPGVPESTMVLHAGATFGRLDGEALRLRLEVDGAVPLSDGRYQLQAEDLDGFRLDEAIFGHVATMGASSPEHVQRFVLLAGRSLLLDFLMLEALLVVDELPPNDVVHLRFDMVATPPTGSVTAPAWGTRPSDVEASVWSSLQSALLPERIAISLCDCDLDLLDIRSVPSDLLQTGDLPSHQGVRFSDGLLQHGGLMLMLGVLLTGAAMVSEHRRRRSADLLAKQMLGRPHSEA